MDLKSLVRRMYSLLHEASAVRRVNLLFSDRTTSPVFSRAARIAASSSARGPGK
jgi:hypothetical protein